MWLVGLYSWSHVNNVDQPVQSFLLYFSWTHGVSIHAGTEQDSVKYSKGILFRFLLSIFAALHYFFLGGLATWCPWPLNNVSAPEEFSGLCLDYSSLCHGFIELISFVSHHSGITLLSCLKSSALKLLWFFFNYIFHIFCFSRWEGESVPIYFILVWNRGPHPNRFLKITNNPVEKWIGFSETWRSMWLIKKIFIIRYNFLPLLMENFKRWFPIVSKLVGNKHFNILLIILWIIKTILESLTKGINFFLKTYTSFDTVISL